MSICYEKWKRITILIWNNKREKLLKIPSLQYRRFLQAPVIGSCRRANVFPLESATLKLPKRGGNDSTLPNLPLS